jgi:hypothetical protein
MAGEGWLDKNLENPKPKQISISFQGDIETLSDEEFAPSFVEARNQSWRAVDVLKNLGLEEMAESFKKRNPHHFKEEGLYAPEYRENTKIVRVVVVARWKEKGEWYLIPLFWKVEMDGGKISLLYRTSSPTSDEKLSLENDKETESSPGGFIKLSPENLKRVEGLVTDFVGKISVSKGSGEILDDGEKKVIILAPQEEQLERRGREEDHLKPQAERHETNYKNPSGDDGFRLAAEIMGIENPEKGEPVKVSSISGLEGLPEGKLIILIPPSTKRIRAIKNLEVFASRKGDVITIILIPHYFSPGAKNIVSSKIIYIWNPQYGSRKTNQSRFIDDDPTYNFILEQGAALARKVAEKCGLEKNKKLSALTEEDVEKISLIPGENGKRMVRLAISLKDGREIIVTFDYVRKLMNVNGTYKYIIKKSSGPWISEEIYTLLHDKAHEYFNGIF